MNPIAIIKLLKIAKDVKDYVKKPNNLAQQNEMILDRMKTYDKKQLKMEKDIKLLKNALKTKGSNKKTDDVKWYDD